jgi:hypothetical protein
MKQMALVAGGAAGVQLSRRRKTRKGYTVVTVHADDTWLLKDLGLFVEPVEVYDPQGKFLGLFVPANLERGKEIYARVLAGIDWKEIERRRQDPRPGVPLKDTLARFKQVEQEIERRKAAGEPPMTNEETMAYYRSLRDRQDGGNGAADGARASQGTGTCTSP